MITFPSGLKFGKGEDSLIDSLFNSNITNDGWYIVTGIKYKTVRFFTGNGKPLFYIVSNKNGITSGNLTTNDGKFYYMTGTCSLTSKKLGLSGYTMEKTTVNNIIRGLSNENRAI
jgi:hypothetical protein